MTVAGIVGRSLASRAWLAYVGVSGGLAVLLTVLPRHGAWVAAELVTTWLLLGAIALGIRLHSPSPRWPWLVLLAGFAAHGIGNSIFFPAFAGITETLPFPSLADGFFVAGYGLIIAGMVSVGICRGAFRQRGLVGDALIVALGVSTVSFEWLIAPYLDPDATLEPIQRLVAIAYPLIDVAILAVVAWMMFSGIRASVAAVLAFGYVGFQLGADAIYGFQLLEGTFGPASPALPLWALSFSCAGAAALHPGMADLTSTVPQSTVMSRGRLVPLSVAAFLAPVVTVINALGPNPDTVVLGSISALIVALAIARTYILVVDVETHRRTVAELERARASYREIVEAVPAVIWVATILPGDSGETEDTFMSPGSAEILGLDRDAVLAGSADWTDTIHPDDRDAVANLFRERVRAASSGQGPDAFTDSYRIVRGNEEVRRIHTDERVVRNAEGTAISVQGIDRDITEQYEAEQLLRASEERFRSLVEQLPAVVFLNEVEADGATHPVYVSPRAVEMFGWAPERLLAEGSNWPSLVHPDSLPAVRAARERHIATSLPVSVIARVVERPDVTGLARWIDVRWVKVDDLDDGRWLSLGVALDVTAQQEADEQMRQSAVDLDRARAQYQGLVEQMPGSTWTGRIIDAATARIEVEFMSPQILEMTGHPADDFRSPRRIWTELVHPEDIDAAVTDYDRWITSAAAHRQATVADVYSKEYRIIHLDGRIRWFREDSRIVRDPAGEATEILGIMIDITEQRLMAEAIRDADARFRSELEGRIVERTTEIEAAREEALKASRAKSEFLSSVSHELRTPLNAILGFGQLLQIAELPPADRESADEVVRAGRHLLGMIEEVLEFSRLDSGRISLSIDPVELASVVREAVDISLPVAAERGVLIEDLVAAGPSLVVLADRRRLSQILLNLLSNAAKFNRSGDRVSLSAVAAGDRVQIRVSDNGVGIAPERLERIFDAFDTLTAVPGAARSIGLGLPLCSRLATLMGGSLTVDSTLGVGSTFTLDLPAAGAIAPADDQPATPTNGTPASSPAATTSVLYIEDNLANIHLVERVLAGRLGVRMLAAMQGRLGLELAREHRPDLILLDLHLPDVEPEETLRELKADERTRAIPVVILSSDTSETRAREMVELGAADFVAKPFDMPRLLAILDRLLGRA